MFKFKKLTKINGFDTKKPGNARQNSYAWSMAELGDYIYVGTARNMFSTAAVSFGASDSNNSINLPSSLVTGNDNCAEIWRYKKDNSSPWQRVLKTKPYEKIYGFRAMITHVSNKPAIYAASSGENINIYKSTDGINWLKINTSNIIGTSSRFLASLNGKLYMAALESGIGGNRFLLYESPDPEFKQFRLVVNPNSANYNPSLNPTGGIDAIRTFNNKLYAFTSSPEGVEVWRSNTCTPSKNQWTLIGDKGFGDKLNFSTLSTGIFNGHLYAAFTKKLPLALFMPLGFDLIRIDENDNWDLVVGGKPIVPSCPSTGKRYNDSLSGYDSGFNNLFNVYGWQIQEYKNNLIITTYDGSTNIKAILQGYLYNKEYYIKQIGSKNYYTLIGCYKKILNLICKYNYPEGFDIYVSKDGCKFKPVILDGLYNPNNYGGRTLYKTCDNKLYLGTANPFDGLEVWEVLSRQSSAHSNTCFLSKEIKSYFCNLKALNNEILKLYPSILKVLYNLLDSTFL